MCIYIYIWREASVLPFAYNLNLVRKQLCRLLRPTQTTLWSGEGNHLCTTYIYIYIYTCMYTCIHNEYLYITFLCYVYSVAELAPVGEGRYLPNRRHENSSSSYYYFYLLLLLLPTQTLWSGEGRYLPNRRHENSSRKQLCRLLRPTQTTLWSGTVSSNSN